MAKMYVLNDHIPIPIQDVAVWAKWFETADRHVAETKVGSLRVSTVFLGLNHSFSGNIPILFETMIFGGAEEYQQRYATWEEAEEGHKKAIKWAELREIQTREVK